MPSYLPTLIILCGNRVTYRMINDPIMLICKHWFRYRCVFHNTIIITEYIGWTINWHTNHSELVSQRNKHIFCGTKRNKFISKTGGLDSILSFWKPYNRRILDVNNNSSMRLTSDNISCMIRMNETWYVHNFTFCFRHIWWWFLVYVHPRKSLASRRWNWTHVHQCQGFSGRTQFGRRSHVSSDKRRYGIMSQDGRVVAVLGAESTVTLRQIYRDVQAQLSMGVSQSIGENAIPICRWARALHPGLVCNPLEIDSVLSTSALFWGHLPWLTLQRLWWHSWHTSCCSWTTPPCHPAIGLFPHWPQGY